MRNAATPNRPPGWSPRGPLPRPPIDATDLAPTDEETLSYLTGDFRIFQRKDGHRWSLDDFATAYVAVLAFEAHGRSLAGVDELREARMQTAPARIFDLGCGIGSVLMMLAWAFPAATLRGIEAQRLSHELALRSLRYNGLEDRAAIGHGDLRELGEDPTFDLVTGTPPYIPLGSGLVSENEQRKSCLNETRGGIEDYALAASRLLTPSGLFVACVGPWPPDRARDAARSAGLHLVHTVHVVPRAGKPVLFRVVVMQRDAVLHAPTEENFTVRDASGELTDQMHDARDVMGQPPQRR